jgi:glycosyltransferase involved in cell wall biosynthesis
VCHVANGMVQRGHSVVTIGGAPDRMAAELDPAIIHLAADGPASGARTLARQRGADVVHVHMTAAEMAAWLARPFQRAPIVATRHFAGDRGSSAPVRALAHLASRSIAVDIAISQFVADSISGPSRLIYNGVADRPAASLENGRVVMLQRLDTEKATDVGLRAWAASGLAGSKWRLLVAGVGRQRPILEGLVDDLGVTNSVDFLGAVDDTDALLASAAIFLAPAPAEPFGLAVVEAMAHGLPVVAAAGGAHRETVGDDALLFAPGDEAAAASHLRALAADAGDRRRVGARLRLRQQERFSLARHLDEIEALYRSLAAGR